MEPPIPRRPGRPSQFSAPRELWDQHRTQIESLYWVDERPLRELMEIMENEHGFCASAKMYKNRFKEWKLEKNIKSDEAKAMLCIRKRRQDEEHIQTEFILRGRPVPDEKLDRFQKRQKIKIDVLPEDGDSAWDLREMGLEFRTPLHPGPVVPSLQPPLPPGMSLAMPAPGPLSISMNGTSHNHTLNNNVNGNHHHHNSMTTEISRARLKIIRSIFKHVAQSPDRLYQDVLLPAVEAGDDELVRCLLDEYAFISGGMKEQLLYVSIANGRCPLVEIVLERGADVNASPPGEAPALHQAVIYHQPRVVEVLLDADAAVDATDDTGRTALGLAVAHNDRAMTECLIEAGADIDLSVRPAPPPLFEALLVTKNIDMARLLEEQGASTCTTESCRLQQFIREEWGGPLEKYLLNHSGYGACKFEILLKACQLGKLNDMGAVDDDLELIVNDLSYLSSHQARKIISLALASKQYTLALAVVKTNPVVTLDEPMFEGKTALELSIEIGNESLVRNIMKHTSPSLYPLALLLAVHHQNLPVAKLLLEAGAIIADVSSMSNGPTAASAATLLQYPLTVAAQNGQDEMVSLLLNHGADPNHHHPETHYPHQHSFHHPAMAPTTMVTPLNLAVDWSHPTTASLLLASGAIPSPTLLRSSLRNRLFTLARQLLSSYGVDPNFVSPATALTPLQEELVMTTAKQDVNYAVIKMLLQYGADIYYSAPTSVPPNPWGQTVTAATASSSSASVAGVNNLNNSGATTTTTGTPSPLLFAIQERNTLLVKCLLDNHECERRRCLIECPMVLREADRILLSDVQDSMAAHERRLREIEGAGHGDDEGRDRRVNGGGSAAKGGGVATVNQQASAAAATAVVEDQGLWEFHQHHAMPIYRHPNPHGYGHHPHHPGLTPSPAAPQQHPAPAPPVVVPGGTVVPGDISGHHPHQIDHNVAMPIYRHPFPVSVHSTPGVVDPGLLHHGHGHVDVGAHSVFHHHLDHGEEDGDGGDGQGHEIDVDVGENGHGDDGGGGGGDGVVVDLVVGMGGHGDGVGHVHGVGGPMPIYRHPYPPPDEL